MDLQSQLDFSRNLLQSLQGLVESFEKFSQATASQSQKMSELADSFKESEKLLKQVASKSQKFSKDISDASNEDVLNKVKNQSKNANEDIKNSAKLAESDTAKRKNFAKSNNAILAGIKKNASSLYNKIRSTRIVTSLIEISIKAFKKLPYHTKIAKAGIYLLNVGLAGVIKLKEGLMTGGGSFLKDIFMSIVNLAKIGAQVISAMIGNAINFFKAMTALPFTIAKLAAEAGFKIRQMVADVKNAGEEAKESFDMTSDIGAGATKLTGMAQGMLKTFQTPRSRLAKLFGLGSQAASEFLKQTFKIVEEMGHYGEIFGQSILSSAKGAQYMIEMQRAMQLNGEELAYFAMEAYNSGKHPYDVLHETSQIINDAANQNDLDFVALNKGFKKLRVNITDFGHLSSNEISNLVVRLRKMRVGTDDAVNVFKKFTSLEEATKASAMLFQSFNMNIDAFDLLTARDPGEMLKQFREAMLATGKSFKDLDRHEKALLQSTTGISEQGLSAMMNHMNNGLSYKEAKKKIEEQDPTEQQTDAIESLSSTIKMFHKVLEFKNPFDAFFRGLQNNSANQKDLMGSVMSLSELYEDIYHLGFSLNADELKGMLDPITNVLSKINLALTGPGFKNALKSTTIAVGEVFNDVAYDLKSTSVGKEFHSFENRIKKATELLGNNNAEVLKSANKTALDVITSQLKLTDPDKEGSKAVLIKELKKKGLLKKIGNNSYKLIEKLSTSRATSFMSDLAEKYKKNPEVLKSIQDIKNEMVSKYDTEIAKAGNGILDILYDPKNNRETVKGRIDHLYEVFSKAFADGSNSFGMIFGIGSNLMGTIIKGLMYGVASALRIFSGSIDVTAKQLGITLPKGKSLKEFTILDALGIKRGEYFEMSAAFSKESTKIAKELPLFVDLASSFIGDLTEVFTQIALGLAGFAGDAAYEYYKSLDDVFGGTYIQAGMRAAGFNVEKAAAASKRAKGFGKEATFNKGFDANKLISAMKYGQDNEFGQSDKTYVDYSYIGTFIDNYKNLKSSAYPGSPVSTFLNNPKVNQAVTYISNQKNFKKSGSIFTRILGNAYDDAEDPQRAQYMLTLIDKAYQIEQIMPQEVWKKISERESLKNFKTSEIQQAFQTANDLANNLPDYTEVGNITDLDFKASNEDVANMIANVQSRAMFATTNKNNMLSEIKKQKIKDGKFKGRNSLMLTGDKIVEFHPEDEVEVIAAKKGDYLNNLFIDFSKEYKDQARFMYDTFSKTTNNLVRSHAETTILSNNIIKYSDYADDVSDEQMLMLVNKCVDTVKAVSKRETIVSDVKVIVK